MQTVLSLRRNRLLLQRTFFLKKIIFQSFPLSFKKRIVIVKGHLQLHFVYLPEWKQTYVYIFIIGIFFSRINLQKHLCCYA